MLNIRDSWDDQSGLSISFVDDDVIGKDTTFLGPFGSRKCIYMDHTASGKPLHSIENFLQKNVLPTYANTHTSISYTSSQTTSYRNEAREIVRQYVNAGNDDVVLFVGSGATGAINKLVHMIQGERDGAPIVFIGPFEHHSNILPWRDCGATTINIPENKYGTVDITYLEKSLRSVVSKKENKGRMLVGVFSAASNITGTLTDDVAVTVLMHHFGGLAFWDYAAAAPHVKIDMNPSESLARKDAIYFSGHKFVGGPQTSGVLVAKRHTFRNSLPHDAGGGTIFFVTPEKHTYLQFVIHASRTYPAGFVVEPLKRFYMDIVEREEGGTPGIIQSIRLGLVLNLSKSIGIKNIIAREAFFVKRALERWSKIPEIIVLGTQTNIRVPIISFLVVNAETGYFLHHNFVVALLNDLFGIQCRGGCMCAGPYSQILLGIDLKIAHKYERLLSEDSRIFRDPFGNHTIGEPEYEMIFRPGFTRLSFPFHAPIEEVDFVIDAVELIAGLGWKLLPLYNFIPEDASFFHHSKSIFKEKQTKSLLINAKELFTSSRKSDKCPNHIECLRHAQYLLHNMPTVLKNHKLEDDTKRFNPQRAPLRWFLLPSEALMIVNGKHGKPNIRSPEPFFPNIEFYSKPKSGKNIWSPGSIPDTIVKNSCWSHKEFNCQCLITELVNESNRNKVRVQDSPNNDEWEINSASDSENLSDFYKKEKKLKSRVGQSHNLSNLNIDVSRNKISSRPSSFCVKNQNETHLIKRSSSVCHVGVQNEEEVLKNPSSRNSRNIGLRSTNSSGYLLSKRSLNKSTPSMQFENDKKMVTKQDLNEIRLEMKKAVNEMALELRRDITQLLSISQSTLLSPNYNGMYHSISRVDLNDCTTLTIPSGSEPKSQSQTKKFRLKRTFGNLFRK